VSRGPSQFPALRGKGYAVRGSRSRETSVGRRSADREGLEATDDLSDLLDGEANVFERGARRQEGFE